MYTYTQTYLYTRELESRRFSKASFMPQAAEVWPCRRGQFCEMRVQSSRGTECKGSLSAGERTVRRWINFAAGGAAAWIVLDLRSGIWLWELVLLSRAWAGSLSLSFEIFIGRIYAAIVLIRRLKSVLQCQRSRAVLILCRGNEYMVFVFAHTERIWAKVRYIFAWECLCRYLSSIKAFYKSIWLWIFTEKFSMEIFYSYNIKLLFSWELRKGKAKSKNVKNAHRVIRKFSISRKSRFSCSGQCYYEQN